MLQIGTIKRMSNTKLTIYFEGAELQALDGHTVAEALLAHGISEFGTNHKGDPRGPFCLMGLCGQCFVNIDDRINVKACSCQVTPLMHISRQHDGHLSERPDEG
jgi:hypothetical protein